MVQARRTEHAFGRPPMHQSVVHVIGLFVTILGALMLIPSAVDWQADNPDWQVFAFSAGLTVFTGLTLFFATRRRELIIGRRQGFLLTVGLWVAATVAGAIPLLLSQLQISFTDAIFEAMSGLTTTGSTVIVGLDAAPPGILLWRSLLQWVGGIGFIAAGLIMLPFLRVGGMQLFRRESSAVEEKPVPQAFHFAAALLGTYLALTLLCALLLHLAGMTWFEAVCHAMTTVSTGGFSTSDQSIGHFDSALIDWIIVVFMVAGGTSFILFVRVQRGHVSAMWGDQQVRTFIGLLAVVSLIMAVWLWQQGEMTFVDALTLTTFNVTSIVTTTGFANTDYSHWGALAVGAFFVLTFVGGCTGSTSGGIKIFRFNVLIVAVRHYIMRLTYPHARVAATYNDRPVTEDVIAGVLLFVATYMVTTAAVTMALTAMGVDLLTGLSGAATAVSNVGPGLGTIIGPAGNFAALPDPAKWVLAFAMLLGRLELFTVFALFSPEFWRQ